MNPFEQKFTKLLEQPVAPAPDPGAAMSDEEAFGASLDQGTDPTDFEVQAPEGQLTSPEDALSQQNAQMAQTLQEWIGRMEEFADYLNGIAPESVQSKLNDAPCDTLFDKIASSETKKVSRVAQDLRSVVEALKTYMLSN